MIKMVFIIIMISSERLINIYLAPTIFTCSLSPASATSMLISNFRLRWSLVRRQSCCLSWSRSNSTHPQTLRQTKQAPARMRRRPLRPPRAQ
eukprot:scaffold71135_cov32-Prasinocladus_malaysianus.AAC.1